MAMRAACLKLRFNLDNLFKLNQCYTTRCFSTSSSKRDEFSPPKKPPSSFILFANAIKENLKSEHPDATYLELTRLASAKWKTAEDSEKKIYQNEFDRKKQAYEKEFKKFKETATEEQLKKFSTKVLTKKQTEKKKSLQGLDSKPKSTRSALNFFTKEVCSADSPDRMPFKDVAAYFKELSPEKKEPYLKQSKLDKIRYEEEMEEWEQKMWEIGRTDLIRQKSMKKF